MKFETYAIARIKGSILDELRAMDWVPRSVRSRAREIERAMTELESKLGRAPNDEEIAAKVGITTEELEAASPTSPAPRSPPSTSSGRSPARRRLDRPDRHIEDTQGPEPQSAFAQTEMREAIADQSPASPSARSS